MGITHTVTTEVDRPDGPPVVASDNMNINLDDHAADDFNHVAAIGTIYGNDDSFIDAVFDVGVLPDIGDVTTDDLLQGAFINNGYFQ